MYRSEFKKKHLLSHRDRSKQALEISRNLDRVTLFAELRDFFSDNSSSRLLDKLMYPDIMVAVPENLRTDWLVQLRPAGRRVIATVKGARMTLRSAKNGQVVKEFPPSDSFMRLGQLTVLDAITDEIGNLFVLDVLCWDSAEISDCEAECRHFWLKSRFAELDISPNFRYIEPVDATPDNIMAVYASDRKFFYPPTTECSFQSDSLLFIHKSAAYWPGLSPLYLQWRDAKICKFPIDTGDVTGRLIPKRQAVVLKAKRRGSRILLKTWDSVKLAEFDEMAQFPIPFAVDETSFLVRGLVEDVQDDPDGPPKLVNLADLQRVTSVRAFPDSLARIRTQAHFRKFEKPIVALDVLLSSPLRVFNIRAARDFRCKQRRSQA